MNKLINNKSAPHYYKYILLCSNKSDEKEAYFQKYKDLIVSEQTFLVKTRTLRITLSDRKIHIPYEKN